MILEKATSVRGKKGSLVSAAKKEGDNELNESSSKRTLTNQTLTRRTGVTKTEAVWNVCTGSKSFKKSSKAL